METIIEQTPPDEMSVTKESYSSIVEEIFEIFVTVWLQIKENKVVSSLILVTLSRILYLKNNY